jgi:hypothetical protein
MLLLSWERRPLAAALVRVLLLLLLVRESVLPPALLLELPVVLLGLVVVLR